MEDDLYLGLMQFSKKIAVALEKTVPCKRIGMSVIGLEVPHAHVHLIPLNDMDEMRFQNKVVLTQDEFETLAAGIAANI
jgi:histidine triad (HIT) family protein